MEDLIDMQENEEITYDITMQTYLGAKKGFIRVQNHGGVLNGTVDILKHTEPFTGTIDENGNFSISGTMVTLMRHTDITATGTITPDGIQLTVQDGRNTFPVTGTLCR